MTYEAGFSSLSHFSNSFRDFYGMSPSRYVELNRDSGQPPSKAVDDKEEP